MLQVASLEVSYGERAALAGVSLEVARGTVLGVLGPSGSGKTSLLRAVAGLESPAAGRVRWDGEDITGVAPHRRHVGLVFQDFVLFPHRDVAGNVGFGLRMQERRRRVAGKRGAGRVDIACRVAEVLDLVGLAGYERRAVTTLSGGEMQRVAVARALAPDPRILLLDEPLGSLDRPLRERLTGELRGLLHKLDVAVLYVTHDQHEAFAIADQVALLRAGRVVQTGSPAQIWRHPVDEFVARFLGFTNLVPAGDVFLVLPPDAVSLDPAADLAGVVTDLAFRGQHFVASVDIGDAIIEVPVIADSLPALGDQVRVAINLGLASVVPRRAD